MGIYVFVDEKTVSLFTPTPLSPIIYVGGPHMLGNPFQGCGYHPFGEVVWQIDERRGPVRVGWGYPGL